MINNETDPAASNRIPSPASRHDRERHGIHKKQGRTPQHPHENRIAEHAPNRSPRRTASTTHETSRTDRRRKNHAPLRPTTRQRLAQRDDMDKTDDNANSITTRHHDEQATPITTRRQERRTTRDARRDDHSKTPSETTRSKDETIYETTNKTHDETQPPPPRRAQENGRSRGYENAPTKARAGAN